MHRRAAEFFSYGLASLLLLSCAGQIAPSGGPPDKTPPEIVSASPAPGTTNFHGNTIRIRFSKYVDPLKLEQSVFVSPNLGTLTYDWSGKDVEIRFSDSLLHPDRTYILTLGTDVEDTRGNKLARAFALPFATGTRIDSASIAGKVIDEKPAGVMVFAYLLNDRRPDTLNPARTPPDYLSQTGNDGAFTITNLAPGTYRLFAVRDEYRNFRYDPQTDQYGVAPNDVYLGTSAAAVAGMQFRLATEDTTRPFLSSARALDRTDVLLRFSEAMDTATLSGRSIAIGDTLSRAPLPVLDCSLLETGLEARLVTAPQESARVYRISFSRGSPPRDLHGNPLNDSAGTPIFDGSMQPDTVQPRVTFLGGQDSVRNVDPTDSLRMVFNKPVRRTSFERGFNLADSVQREIPGRMIWSGSMRAAFAPILPLAYGAWYRAALRLDSVRDVQGNRGKDTLLLRRFQTVSEDTLGSIAGTISDEVQGVAGTIVLFATDVEGKNAGTRRLALKNPGPFSFEHLPEGRYALWAFRDIDGNGFYSPGAVFPFHPSERFTVYPDTAKVRARWPLEGVNMQLKRE